MMPLLGNAVSSDKLSRPTSSSSSPVSTQLQHPFLSHTLSQSSPTHHTRNSGEATASRQTEVSNRPPQSNPPSRPSQPNPASPIKPSAASQAENSSGPFKADSSTFSGTDFRLPLKGILKKPSASQSSYSTISFFRNFTSLSTKRYKRGVTFCLQRPGDSRFEFVPTDDEADTESTTTSSGDELKKASAGGSKPSKSSRKLGRSGTRRKERKKRLYRSAEEEAAMAAKTAPGPLSLGLYTFLCIITVGMIILFGSSEWRSVETRSEILPLVFDYVPVSCEGLDENDGRVVHIDCPLQRLQTFYPPNEFAWNVEPFKGVFFDMRVEMYQWILKSKALGFTFEGRWSPNLVDSSSYPFLFFNTHVNPDYFPHISGAGRRFAKDVYGGMFRLPKTNFIDFHGKRQLPLQEDGYYTASNERPPTRVTYGTTQVHENALYTGNPLKPKIGDVRITFWGSTATHVSAIAKQTRSAVDGEFELVEYFDGSEDDYRREGRNATRAKVHQLVYEGDHTPAQMFNEHIRRREGPYWTLWAIRLGTGFLLTVVIAFSYRIIDSSARVAVTPLVLGAALLAAGLILFAMAPLWLLCDIWRPIIFWILSPFCLAFGVMTWSTGKEYASRIDETELTTRAGLLQAFREPRETSSQHSKHFYQAV